MKKNVILSLVFITLILLIGSCACSCEHNYMEGFTQTVTAATLSAPKTYKYTNNELAAADVSKIQSITTNSALTTANVLIETGADKTLTTSDYCAILDTNSSATAKGLMILKKNNVDWQVIWASNLSNALWHGSSLTLANAGTLIIGGNNIAEFAVPTDGTDALTLTLVDGDLLITKGPKLLWSLLDSELSSAKSKVELYMKSSETDRVNLNFNDKLKNKLKNLNTYIDGIRPTLGDESDNYKKIDDIRHKMDFELSEINRTSGTKLNLSQTTLQSTMYVNLAISVLAVSLFVLLYSR